MPIFGGVVGPDGRGLVVDGPWCNRGHVTANESATEVRLVATTGDAGGGDCEATAVLCLDHPLGDRRLVDSSTNKSITIEADLAVKPPTC